MKTGLVLEGGAMRGMFTAGVLDVFMDEGIKFDSITGVSAGAVFGVNFLSGQKGRALRYCKRFNNDKRYMSFKSLITTGNLVNKEFAYGVVPEKYDVFEDETFMKSGVPYYAVVTNMVTGKREEIRINSVYADMEILRASASMPFISRPVMLSETPYLDGGVSDSIPFKRFIDEGYDKMVIILTREKEYKKEKMSALPIDLCYSKYPEFKKALKNRHNMYNESVEKIKELEKEGRAFVIRPREPLQIKRMEKSPEGLQKVYDEGVNEALKEMNRLKEYLGI